MPEAALREIAKDYRLNAEQLGEIFKLLDQGYSIPYLMRYHKGLTAALTEEQVHELVESKRDLDRLERRRAKILKKLKEQDLLNEDLEERIQQAATTSELMDYYVPYRPRKRSRSRQALAQGLGTLAKQIQSQEKFFEEMGTTAEEYVDPDKGLESAFDVVEGVSSILCDWIAEGKTHRDRQRKVLRQSARVVCDRSNKSVPGRLAREFQQYFNFNSPAKSVHPYKMLRITRGQRLKVLDYRVDLPLDKMYSAAAELYLMGGAEQYRNVMAELPDSFASLEDEDVLQTNSTEFLCLCIRKSINDILGPVLARELDKELCQEAEKVASGIVRGNVRSVVWARPMHGKVIMGINAGYRTGCKLAVLDGEGQVVETDTVHPHTPLYEVEEAKETIQSLVEKHGIELVAIGEGTGSQETENVISELIEDNCPDLQYAVVPALGVESYAKGGLGRKELKDHKPKYRMAIAFGRRLRDPLRELIKIDPLQLCTSEYAQDLDKGRLEKLVRRVVENCICAVGVELNSAPVAALRYLDGLDHETCQRIVERRKREGLFENREQLKEVPGVGEGLFRKVSGFVKVNNSSNPLDRTRIHPSFYPVAEKMCEQIGVPVEKIETEEGAEKVREKRNEIDLSELEKEFDVHYLVLKDIADELVNPWPEPRTDAGRPVLRQRQKSFDELEPGQKVTGIVRNVADFGVFVDIGVGEDGLIHVSELADHFVHNPYEVVSTGQVVEPTIVEVQPKKKRIALSLKSKPKIKKRKPKRTKKRRASASREATEKAKKEVPGEKPSRVAGQPQSTVGWKSRRVQKAKLDTAKAADEDGKGKAAGEGARKQEAPQRSEEQEREQKESGDLLDMLDFGSRVEKRGEDRE